MKRTVSMELEFGAYRLRRVDDQFGERWGCTRPEFATPKPLTPRPWCKHCDWAITLNPPPRHTLSLPLTQPFGIHR